MRSSFVRRLLFRLVSRTEKLRKSAEDERQMNDVFKRVSLRRCFYALTGRETEPESKIMPAQQPAKFEAIG